MKAEKDHNGYYYYKGWIYYKSGYTSLWVTTPDEHKTPQYHADEQAAIYFIDNQTKTK